MTLADFIQKIEESIDTLPKEVLKGETKYRELPEWSSMHALIIIAMVDLEYEVALGGEEIRNSETISDLFNLVQSRKN